MEEVIEQFADIFCTSLRMLQKEIEINQECNNTFYDVDILVAKWNELYDEYFGESEVKK